MTISLTDWNQLDAAAALEAILPCNGSRAWATAMVHARPLGDPEALFTWSDIVWRGLTVTEWQEAFESHPRIGETHARTAGLQSLGWSTGEQSAVQPDELIKAALSEGNRAYEARFSRIFLVCATGKSAAEILDLLRRRLGNDPQIELLEAAEQQRRITQLRLRKWLGLPPASCEAV